MAQTMMVNVLPTAPAAAVSDAANRGNAVPPETGASPFPQMLQRQIAAPQPAGKETGSKSHGAAADKDAVPADTGTGHGATSPLTTALAAWLGVVLPGGATAGQAATPDNNVPAALSAVADAGTVSAGVQTAAGGGRGLGGSGQGAAPLTPGQITTASHGGVTPSATTAAAAMPIMDVPAAETAGAVKLPGGFVNSNGNGAVTTVGSAAAVSPTAVSAVLSSDINIPPALAANAPPMVTQQPLSATTNSAVVAPKQTQGMVMPQSFPAMPGSSHSAAPLFASAIAAAANDAVGTPTRTAGNATAAPTGAFFPGNTATPGVLITAAGAAAAAQQGTTHDGASPRHDDTAQQTAAAMLSTPAPTPAAEVAVPASGPSAAQPEQQSIIRQIVDQAFLAVQQDKQEMHIKLKPEQLGTVTLHIAVDDGRVNARFYVDNAAVQQVLEGSLGQLRQQLAGQGFNVQQLAVFNGFGRDWPQPGHRQPGPHRAARRAPVAAVTEMDGAAVSRDVWRRSTSGIDYRV